MVGDVIVFLCSVFGEFCVGVWCLMWGISGGDIFIWYLLVSVMLVMWVLWWEVKGIESFLDFFGGMGDSGYGLSNGIWFGS